MIRLDIQPYCENYMDFEADVEKPVALYADFCLFEQLGDTIIRYGGALDSSFSELSEVHGRYGLCWS